MTPSTNTWVHLEFEKLEPVGHRGPMATQGAHHVQAHGLCDRAVFVGITGCGQALPAAETAWHHVYELLPAIRASHFAPADLIPLEQALRTTLLKEAEGLNQTNSALWVYLPMPEPVAVLATVMACQQIASAQSNNKQNQINLVIRLGMPDELARAHGPKLSAALRFAQAAQVPGLSLHVTAETPAVANYYQQACGITAEVQVAPCPNLLHMAQQWQTDADSRQKAARRLVYLGEAREEKGYQYLPVLLRALLLEPSDLESPVGQSPLQVTLHSFANGENQTPAIEDAREQLQNLAGTLTNSRHSLWLINSPVSAAHYNNTLLAADVCIMPYRASAYSARGSGVLDECLASNTRVIINEDCQLYRDYRGHPLVFPLHLANSEQAKTDLINALHASRAGLSGTEKRNFCDGLTASTRKLEPDAGNLNPLAMSQLWNALVSKAHWSEVQLALEAAEQLKFS